MLHRLCICTRGGRLEVIRGNGPKVHCWRARVRYSYKGVGVVDVFGNDIWPSTIGRHE